MVFCSTSNLIQFPNHPNSLSQQRILIRLGLGRYKSESLKSTRGNLMSARLGLTTLWKMQVQKRTTCVWPEVFVQHTFTCHHMWPQLLLLPWFEEVWDQRCPLRSDPFPHTDGAAWSLPGALSLSSGILSALTLGPWESKLMYCSKVISTWWCLPLGAPFNSRTLCCSQFIKHCCGQAITSIALKVPAQQFS